MEIMKMAEPPWLYFAKDGCVIGRYLASTIAQKFRLEPITGGFIVLNIDGIWVNFAVLNDMGGTIAADGSTLMEVGCVFWGDGPSGNLRECRHTFWGEEDNGGYIFYPSGLLIAAAFKRLSEFFDDMA
jgi:hypothetical protein